MLRRNFLKSAGLLASVPLLQATAAQSEKTTTLEKEIYEWRIYDLCREATELDRFFEKTLIPAYNRLGIKVGAFELYKKEEKEQRFILFVYPNISTYHKVKQAIWKDKQFTNDAKQYFESTAKSPIYTNFETFLCEAFDKIPQMRKPEKSRTLFELRIYHSPNEEANQRKVRMFNVDEIDIFDKVGINSVCYGDILAGPRMPALAYLTWYYDEPTRNEAWKKFVDHPDWNRIKVLPEYANTATNNKNRLLNPLNYSQF